MRGIPGAPAAPGCAAPLRPGSTGTAAHRTGAEAVCHAALEVLERDLLWHAWYGDGPGVLLTNPTFSPQLAAGLLALDLSVTVLLLPGPGATACVVACLHNLDRTEQTFGARATVAGTTGDRAGLVPAVEAAVHEALMVRWSMRSAAAWTTWQRMCHTERSTPRGPLEHALHTYHRQDSLAHLLAGSTANSPTAPVPVTHARVEVPITGLLTERTSEDVVTVDTTVPDGGPAGTVVVQVVAPGARRLPADERAQPPLAEARTRLPHPLG